MVLNRFVESLGDRQSQRLIDKFGRRVVGFRLDVGSEVGVRLGQN